MICATCSTPNRLGATYCVNCGAPLDSGPLAACAACNAELRVGAAFCHRCGARVSGVAQDSYPVARRGSGEVGEQGGAESAAIVVGDARVVEEAGTACGVCGQVNRAGARYCRVCRAPLFVLCEQCGAENRATAAFCKECGGRLSGAPAAPAIGGEPEPATTQPPPRPSRVICEQCGATILTGARFCPQCGKTPTSRLLPFEDTYSTGQMPRNHKLRGSDGAEYIVLRLIARGGMGAVYEVGRTGDNTRWALKEMSETAIARGDRVATIAKFREEAELLRDLRHENLPRLVDVFEDNHRHYLVMELIEGQTLKALLEERGPLPEKDVVAWGAQLCQVLAFLHTRRPPIIYRDLKPENVMLDATGERIKLIDFGIARRFKGGKRSDTFMLGTRGYAAPEQFGKQESDARTDLFALGATLHHLLTNENPTNRRLFAFPSLDNYTDLKISRRTSTAIAAAVEQSPDDRPADAAAFFRALTGKPMPPPPPATDRRSSQVLGPPRSRPRRAAPTLTGRLQAPYPLDLGQVERGQVRRVAIPLADSAGSPPVQSRAAWLMARAEPSGAGGTPAGQEVKVVAQTSGLELARRREPVAYRPRFVIDSVWWLLLWLYHAHAQLFVPAPRRHEGVVRVGRQDIDVAVTVTPPARRVEFGRFLSAAAVTLEVGVLLIVVLALLRAAGLL